MQYHMRRSGITLRLGEKVKEIKLIDPESDAPPETAKGKKAGKKEAEEEAKHKASAEEARHLVEEAAAAAEGDAEVRTVDEGRGTRLQQGPLVMAVLESGKKLRAQTLLFSVGRQGTVNALNVKAAGIEASDRERLKVNDHYQTSVKNIYAIGDVIGFPSLASTSMEQGRLAACHAFGVEATSLPDLFPLGIYAIPEISMVGKTEEQLTEAGIPYEAGIAEYKEIARGQLLGDETGMLKLLIHQEDRTILGVHAIGSGATELIHIGQACMALGGKVEFFVRNVFNYPTLAEAYKVAALNGLNKLQLT